MLLSREIDIKLCQIYTKIYININICVKIVGLNRSYSSIRNKSETDDIPDKHEKLRFAPFII